MAVLDLTEQGLRVDDVELATLLMHAAAAGEPLPSPRPEPSIAASLALADAGVLVDGTLGPIVARVVGILTQPALEMHLECYVVAATYFLDVAVTRDGAVLSRTTEDGLTELLCVDLDRTPFAILRAVGLGARPDPPQATPIILPSTVLADLGAHGDPDGADGAEALVAAGLSRGDAEAAVLLVLQRRLSFRITSLWRLSAEQLDTAEVTVVDGGKMGLWFSESDFTAGTTTLTPTSVRGVVEAVAALVPMQGIDPWG